MTFSATVANVPVAYEENYRHVRCVFATIAYLLAHSLNGIHISQNEFSVDDLNVAYWICSLAEWKKKS